MNDINNSGVPKKQDGGTNDGRQDGVVLKKETKCDGAVNDASEDHKTKVDLSGAVAGLDGDGILDVILSRRDEILPWDTVVLPSKGYYYGGKIPDGVVKIRPMNIFTEKIMSTQRWVRTGEAINKVFEHCVQFPDPSFDVLDLLSGDATFLLYYLRGITYGNMYEFIMKCDDEECGHSAEYSYDLNQLQHTIKGPNEEFPEEPFPCTLPYMSEVIGKPFIVHIRLIRRRDLMNITVARKRKKLLAPSSSASSLEEKLRTFTKINSVTTVNDFIEENLNNIVVSVMGSKDRNKIRQFINMIHSSDSAAIREALDSFSPGIDTTIEVTCPMCGNRMKTMLPITESFFRRTPARDGGK